MDNNIDQWSCCSIKNKEEIRYFIQCGFGIMIMIFCMFKLISNNSNNEVYISLLSSTLGYFLPAPTMNR